jgi:pyruvate dehydrogenase E2 component (dihydrolipoamide acetyltransferase)
MPTSVVMPALEMAQETGKLICWLKKEGESVAKGEPLLEIETDKAVMEIESPADGLLAGVKAAPGAEVPVGRTIAWIVAPGESVPAEEQVSQSGRKLTTDSTTVAGDPSSATLVDRAYPTARAFSSDRSAAPKISPKARRLASEHGVNLAEVRGSGPDGEILASDILAAAEKKSPPSVSAPAATSISRLMAERTTQSWTTVPHFFASRDIGASALNSLRQTLSPEIEKSHRVKLTHSDLLVSLVARVLEKHPALNSSWAANGVSPNSEINISIAIAVDGGVVAPVIHRANRLSLAEIALLRRDLADRSRAGRLRPTDLAGGTFTISNLGMFGIDAFTAIITPPQAAILAVGAISNRVVAVDSDAGAPGEARIEVRPMMTLTLSSDHRVIDGARAAQFLRDLTGAISHPYRIPGVGST